ncbi:MAG: DUF1810 domain-containing protein [Proteobacteria bacterium]|nr:DUF1810 domain-containing protein [Pseudomonadota bacterium]
MTTPPQGDPYRLSRFVQAQAPVYAQVRGELAAGEKRSHWMWFVFPQLAQLGRSSTAQFYGIGSRGEAAAYWQHPLLGDRLAECTSLVLAVQGRTALQVFHSPDDLKFRSCMTLFHCVVPQEPLFGQALDKYYAAQGDPLTLSALEAMD